MKIRLGLILLISGILAIVCIGLFMFTTTRSSPTTLKLHMPKDSEDSVDRYNNVKTKLTLILLKDDRVFGYYGDFIKDGRSVLISETDKLIEDGRKMFSKDSLVVVIKPTETASYKETVDMLDQMTINKIEKYTMADLSKEEKEFINKSQPKL